VGRLKIGFKAAKWLTPGEFPRNHLQGRKTRAERAFPRESDAEDA
jgi:hypothetical protein